MEPWLGSLRDEAHRSVASVLHAGACALLGYPNHTNPGDHAIWLGAKAILERRQIEIAYECSWKDYSRAALANAVASGAEIVFTEEATSAICGRRRMRCASGSCPISPASGSCSSRRASTSRQPRVSTGHGELIRRHGNVVLLVRDEPSLEVARSAFDAAVGLCPDLAFACSIEPPTGPAVADIVWVAREDRESRGLNPRGTPSGVWRVGHWNLRRTEPDSLDGEAPIDPSVPQRSNATVG